MKPKNERGAAAIGIVLVILVLGAVLLQSLQSQTLYFAHQLLESRTQLDAESAIDHFAVELQRAYILGSPVADSINGKRYRDSDLIDYKGFKLFAPSGRSICFRREVGMSSSAPICIQLPENLVVKNISGANEVEVAVLTPADQRGQGPQLRDFALGFAKATLDMFTIASTANANPFLESDPGAGPMNALSFTVTRNFDTEFTRHYSDHNCSGATPYDCITVKFCMRLNQTCSAEEFIQQSYVFDRPPQTQLKN